ncbi:MAG TPA: TetR/AcrR family transcriptional regulator [Acidimicrobiia bacterium]|nr:TetR/AcrR family transcriptional regulator [Acidimicrobiia bacterium]
MMQNAIPEPVPAGPEDDVATVIAQQRLAKRGAQYSNEVRRLLDAGLEVMRRCGTASRPRVADIVAAAGLSNDAFYRHFASKEALVAAILDDGSMRLASYLTHQMAKASTPHEKVRSWVDGVLAQAADDEIAVSTLAVMWNGATIGNVGTSRPSTTAPLARLLEEPFAAAGSTDPRADAVLAAHAVVGMLSDFLWAQERPTRARIDHAAEFCIRAITR